jgi:DNA polymerase
MLFDDLQFETVETIEEINAELLMRAKAMPSAANRTFILGEGKPRARLALVGESPGPPDAASGRPFMGPVGDMLDRILSGIGIKRSECYLTNTVKLISTGDQITPALLSFFTPYLHRELAAIGPQMIVALGNTPARALLNTKQAISQIRGQVFDFRGIPLIPTFNPAYLLRDPTRKREAWEDMKRVRERLRERR